MVTSNMDGDRRHHCLTPVFTWKYSVSQAAGVRLHVIPSYVLRISDIFFSGIP